jgi:hypothetical protein
MPAAFLAPSPLISSCFREWLMVENRQVAAGGWSPAADGWKSATGGRWF